MTKEQALEAIKKEAERLYPKSDKVVHEITDWTLHNLFIKYATFGLSLQDEVDVKSHEEILSRYKHYTPNNAFVYYDNALSAMAEAVQQVVDQLTEIQLQTYTRHREELAEKDKEIAELKDIIKQQTITLGNIVIETQKRVMQ
jgi:hypothetical protein